MFGIGMPEMILILALALIVVGPDKLPDLARSVAKGVLELKKTVSTLKEDLAEDNPLDAVAPELKETAESIKKQLTDATPDGFSGIVTDLKEGIQEVIDTDGTVIPVNDTGTADTVDPVDTVSTDDIIKTVAESSELGAASDDGTTAATDVPADEPDRDDISGTPSAPTSAA